MILNFLYQQILECFDFLFAKYELSKLKMEIVPVILKWCSNNCCDVSLNHASDSDLFIAVSEDITVTEIHENLTKDEKFYQGLLTSFKIYPENPLNRYNNCLLASSPARWKNYQQRKCVNWNCI